MEKITEKEFREIRDNLFPLQKKLGEFSITYEDLDINKRLHKATTEVRDFLTEMWYFTKEKAKKVI